MLKYNIVFLDINMDRLDGIGTAKKIREISREIYIVFVTAFIDYTLEGYKVDAIRYILKNNSMLRNGIDECMDAIQEKMNYKVVYKDFDFCEGKRSISLEHILYVESNLHKLKIYVLDNEVHFYTIYMTLDELESELCESGFLRIHQSYLVNKLHISKIFRYRLIMCDGTELNIPKTRYNYVQKAVAEYKGEL